MKKSVVIITAIIAITLMQCAAFYFKIDGNLLLASVSAVAGLAGYSTIRAMPK